MPDVAPRTVRFASGARLQCFPDAEAVADAAAETFATEARKATQARGVFRVLLSGGSTPRRMLERLAQSPYDEGVDWPRVRFFFGDERAVGPESPDSNYAMARTALFDHLRESSRFVERMRGESEDLARAASDYEEAVAHEFGILREDPPPSFDLVYLGMGEDGHTASLFPNTRALDERERWFVANEVPQLATQRLTATFALLERARRTVFLVCGESKGERLREIIAADRQGAPSPHPSGRVRAAGRVEWFVDEAAGKGLA